MLKFKLGCYSWRARDSASSSANSMAGSSDANNVPEGTTLVFGSWACMANGSGGFSSHLVMPNSPKPKATLKPVNVCKIADLNGKRAILKLSPDKAENVSTSTQTVGSVEFDINSDSEKPHFSETLGKYVTYLKSIKRPKMNNSELLNGVDRVS